MDFSQLPLYEAKILQEDDGILCVSIVDYPATETDFCLFGKQERTAFQIEDEEKHLLTSVVMVADTPIYRRDESGYEYNIIYHKDTIREMAEKLLKDSNHNTFDLMHDGNRLPKGDINIVELYIVDKEKGIAPNFTDVPDGSLMATYKIHNEELWQRCKSGEFHGISLEGLFTIEKEQFNNKKSNINKFMDLIESLKSLIVEAESEKETVKAEEEVKEEVTEPQEEETPTEEPKEDETQAKLDEINARIDEIIARVEALEEELTKTVETPIEEQPIEEGEELSKFAKIGKLIRK